MGRKKKEFEEQKSLEDLVEEQWDLRKIIIGIVTVGILGAGAFFGFYYFGKDRIAAVVLGSSDKKEEVEEKVDLLSEQSKDEIIKATKKDADKLIERLQKELDKLQSEEFASSTGQIQKILNDLKELQEKQKEPKDFFCEYVCKKE